MLDIGWSELVLIGIVALIVVGPKDLPRMFHALGRMTARLKSMAREFQGAMNDAAKASGLDEVRKDLNEIKASTSTKALGIDALENAASKFEKWDPKSVIRPTPATPPAAATISAGAPAAAAPASVVTAAPSAMQTLVPPAGVSPLAPPAALSAPAPAAAPVASSVAPGASPAVKRGGMRRKRSDQA